MFLSLSRLQCYDCSCSLKQKISKSWSGRNKNKCWRMREIENQKLSKVEIKAPKHSIT